MVRDTTSGSVTFPRRFLDGADTRYQAYSYSYPHKTAYRDFPQPVPLKELWKAEKRDALFLYLHIPFCEMRCGFCNLFTTTNPEASLEKQYLDAVERQCHKVAETLGDASFARMALGGGTPTYLNATDLDRLFDIVDRVFKTDPEHAPCSVETSPYTAETEKLSVLKERGVNRMSIGIQSFIESEVRAIGRSQDSNVVRRALERLKQFNFPTLNVDLMYGLPGQTFDTWTQTLSETLSYEPEQVYLYPLYIRPLTGMGRQSAGRETAGMETADIRLELYRQARTVLTDNGYQQSSMRMFERRERDSVSKPVYCCQDDGMIGIGCGARSYTSAHHYSMRYAVGQKPIRDILHDYVNASSESFSFADYGFVLNDDERKRRFVIQSLLQLDGLSFDEYYSRFNEALLSDFSNELNELQNLKLVETVDGRMYLTETGLEWSDRIGFELYSADVKEKMNSYENR